MRRQFLYLKQAFLVCALCLVSLPGQSQNEVEAHKEIHTTVILGDVEGQWDRLESFTKNSAAFFIDKDGQLNLKPGYRFVFMGDATDKGNSSLRILSTLLKLKEFSPDRVVLILGNRDINKLRLPHELSEQALQGPPNEEAATQSFQNWLTEKGLSQALYSDATTRMKWILEKTMGAGQAFEFRRQELARELAQENITDIQVLESFKADFAVPEGIMSRYLKAAQLAFVDHLNKTLFVHGGVTAEAYGTVPGQEKVMDLNLWVHNLNEWAHSLIIDGTDNASGSVDLVRYQQPIQGTHANQSSVVYGRNFDASANPELPPEAVQKVLLSQGVESIIVGHTPVGEIPVIASNGHFRIVFADNSFSKSRDSASILLRQGELSVSAQSPVETTENRIAYKHFLNRDLAIGSQGDHGWIVGDLGVNDLSFKINREQGFKVEYKVSPKSERLKNLCSLIFL